MDAKVISTKAQRCRRKFTRIFPNGFHDEDYVGLERDYKWSAHRRWVEKLNRKAYEGMLREGCFSEIATLATSIEARTNLIFSFEKMALRDAVKDPTGARIFSEGLFDLLHGTGAMSKRFERWCNVIAALPRKKTRVFTWPNATVFGFLAQPRTHFFVKPTVMRRAAEKYGFDLHYTSKPSWDGYSSMLALAAQVRSDLSDLHPRDMIDVQSFLWVQGSDEY